MACSAADLRTGKHSRFRVTTRTGSPPQKHQLGLTYILQSQKPVPLPAKASGTVKYEALKSIYTVLAAALRAPEALSLVPQSLATVCAWAKGPRFEMEDSCKSNDTPVTQTKVNCPYSQWEQDL